MALKNRRFEISNAWLSVVKRGASPVRFVTFLALLASALSGTLPAAKALAEDRITMMPPQISSPAGDVYMWGDRLIISFRISGETAWTYVGVDFESSPHMRELNKDENLTTFELQLDSENTPELLQSFAAGRPYVYGRAFISGYEHNSWKGFWVMNPARRWPDALRFVEPHEGAAAREIRVAVSLPDDRVDADYYLDLIQLPMRLPGGTVTTPVPMIAPVKISEDQREYAIPIDLDSGVYEIRLRGPGDYVHDVKRFQYSRILPKVSYTGLETETYAPGARFYKGQVEVQNYPADKNPQLFLRSVSDVQVAGHYVSIQPASRPTRAENWNAKVLLTEPTEFELTTSYLGDEIVLGRFSAGMGDEAAGDPNTTGEFESLPNSVQEPGSAFTFGVLEDSFLDEDHVWVFLRQNVSGRQPKNAPSSASDRLIQRWKVSKDSRTLQMAAPKSAGEYRIDVEMPDEEGGDPSGIVSYAILFSVIEGETEAVIEMEEDQVIMGTYMNFQVHLPRRHFAAPITIEAVRPAGVSSAGTRFASRTPPISSLASYKQILWSAGDVQSSLYPSDTYSVRWGTSFWAPGRYEARVIVGNEAGDGARVLGRKSFEVIVPPAPGAITSIDDEDRSYEVVDVTLPDWARTVFRTMSYKDYGFSVALVRPRSRTVGNALRFEKILGTVSMKSINFRLDGFREFSVPGSDFVGELQVWLLMDVNCFSNTCPTAILDRKSFFFVGVVKHIGPSPDHIADRFIFPEDNSFSRPGRAFPDIHPE